MFRTAVHNDPAIVGSFIASAEALPRLPQAEGELTGAVQGSVVTLLERPVGFQPTVVRCEAMLLPDALEALDKKLETGMILRYLYPGGVACALSMRAEKGEARLELGADSQEAIIEGVGAEQSLLVTARIKPSITGFERSVEKLLRPESLIILSRYVVGLVRNVADSHA